MPGVKSAMHNTLGDGRQEPLCFGDKVFLACDEEMLRIAGYKYQKSDTWVLGCPVVQGMDRRPVVVAPLFELGEAAEFIVEDFDI